MTSTIYKDIIIIIIIIIIIMMSCVSCSYVFNLSGMSIFRLI